METLKIEIPQGHEVESFDKSSGVIKFREKPKPVTERIKTIEDVLESLDEDDDDVIAYEDLADPADFPEHIANYQLAVLIAKSFNEGWVPDWKNHNQAKYYPWFEMAGSSGFRCGDYYVAWFALSTVGSRLCFKSRELAEYAGKQFTEVYKQFMVIN